MLLYLKHFRQTNVSLWNYYKLFLGISHMCDCVLYIGCRVVWLIFQLLYSLSKCTQIFLLQSCYMNIKMKRRQNDSKQKKNPSRIRPTSESKIMGKIARFYNFHMKSYEALRQCILNRRISVCWLWLLEHFESNIHQIYSI